MPMPFIDHFSGFEAQTCSYTTDFITKNATAAIGNGMTEADYRKHLTQSHWGFLQGQIEKGELKIGSVMFRADHPMTGIKGTFIYNGEGKMIIRKTFKSGKIAETNGDLKYLELYLKDEHWDMRVPTHRTPAVSSNSNSIGALTDEDAAAMFVKVKDDFAKSKGINIKGANPQLDLEVFEAVGKATGYSANEIRLKIEAYKAAGNKLSALKKKVLSGTKKVHVPDPVSLPPAVKPKAGVPDAPAPKVDASWLDNAKPITGEKVKVEGVADLGFKATYKGHKVATALDETDFMGKHYYSVDFWDKDGDILGYSTAYQTKQEAVDAAQKHAEKHFADVEPKVQPAPVHVEASKPAVKEALDNLESSDNIDALLYKDEDVVKAYIKAKDQLAADPSNPWTLYTKGDEFDAKIYHLMSKEYGVDLSGKDIQKHIANYLGSGNKVSVLKKKMIKSGELDPAADTLKKTKAEKQFNTAPTHSATEAKSQIDNMANTAEAPFGSKPYTFTGGNQQEIFDQLKNGIYASMSEGSAWAKFEEMAVKYRKIAGNDNISALDIMRVYDKLKAKQLGIDNGFFYEKKITSWASSPEGKSHIMSQKASIEAKAKIAEKQLKDAAAKKAKEEEILKSINANIPDLPADSAQYQVITTSYAERLQNSWDPWNAAQKDGLRHYTTGAYTPMNDFLRGKTTHISSYNRIAVNSAQMGMRPATESFLVRRGAGYQSFGIGQAGKYGFDATDHAKFRALIGKTVEEPGFLSTSVGGEGAFGGSVKIEVEITPGTYGAYVDHISANRGEREFIVARGTRYQVLQVKATVGHGGVPNQTVIRLRTIPGTHAKGSI